MGCEDVEWIALAQDMEAVSCGHPIEISGVINGRKFLKELGDHWLLMKESGI